MGDCAEMLIDGTLDSNGEYPGPRYQRPKKRSRETLPLRKGGLKKVRLCGFEIANFGLGTCDECKLKFGFSSGNNIPVACKEERNGSFGKEITEIICIPCLEKVSGKKILKEE